MKRSNRCFWDNMDKMTTWEQQSPICSASRAWQHPATINCHLPHWLDVSMATHGVRDAASGWAETSQMHSPQLEWVMTRRMLIPPKNQDGGGERGRNRQKEKRKYRDDSRTSVTGTSCGWKTQHCNSPCNYILIMHMKGIVRSDHRHPPDT